MGMLYFFFGKNAGFFRISVGMRTVCGDTAKPAFFGAHGFGFAHFFMQQKWEGWDLSSSLKYVLTILGWFLGLCLVGYFFGKEVLCVLVGGLLGFELARGIYKKEK